MDAIFQLFMIFTVLKLCCSFFVDRLHYILPFGLGRAMKTAKDFVLDQKMTTVCVNQPLALPVLIILG